MQMFTPCLWFDNNAEEAVKFYTSIFKDSEITGVTHYGQAGSEAAGKPKGTVMTIAFRLNGQEFLALNGGPIFKFNEAVSFIVNCQSQEEIEYYWENLSEDGDKKAQQCGWLKDKFGLSWQIVPTALSEMLQDKDSAKAERVMKAMLQMKKINIKILKQAYKQELH